MFDREFVPGVGCVLISAWILREMRWNMVMNQKWFISKNAILVMCYNFLWVHLHIDFKGWEIVCVFSFCRDMGGDEMTWNMVKNPIRFISKNAYLLMCNSYHECVLPWIWRDRTLNDKFIHCIGRCLICLVSLSFEEFF